VLPPQREREEVKYYGLLPLAQGPEVYMSSPYDIFKQPARDFTELFKEFCLNSFLITPEAIRVLQDVRNECNRILEYEFFSLA
jgi:hypothetical protein